ncbi:MAG: flagellar biosynthetic protein FliO [Defluviitaleaceae bacterium]|nr:flagellar biosynthetic protein FliO [Defluviitaleaceae bacterium]
MFAVLYINPPESASPFSTDGLASAWQLLTVIGVLALVLFLAYFSIRLMGKVRGGLGSRHHRNIKMVEGLGVGPQSSVQLVQAGDKFFLIGVSRNGITLLGEVSGDSIIIDNKPLPDMPFEKYLSRLMPKKKDDAKSQTDDTQPKE